MGTYTYMACDLITGNARERVNLTDVTAERLLNSPGDFSAAMPLGGLRDRETGAPNRVLQQAALDATDPARSTIVVLRDGVAMGEWIIWHRPQRGNDGRPVHLAGSYITSYFDSVRPTFSAVAGDLPEGGWVATEQLTIAAALAGQCDDPITSSTAPPGSRGIALTIPAITPSGIQRDQFDWPGKGKYVGPMLAELAALPGGFDWDIDVAWAGDHVIRTLTLSYPRRGIDSGIVLQPAEGKPGGNVAHAETPEDGTRIATQIIGVGGGSGDGQATSRSNNPALVSAYPLLQSVVTDTSIFDPNQLQARTDAAAFNARTAQLPPKVKVLADGDPTLGSYRCGDYVTLMLGVSANYPVGYLQKVRILGIPITPPAEGPETVDLSIGLVQES